MYMDILEQEVEALSAEVTRLRLMVHRVTQVMEAPPPSHHRHTDPLRIAPHPPPTTSGEGSPANLQATVDSYKQILPLIQLLLEQQQQQQRPHRTRRHTSSHRSSKDKKAKEKVTSRTARRRRNRHGHSRRSPSSSTVASADAASSSASSYSASHADTRNSASTSTSRSASSSSSPSRPVSSRGSQRSMPSVEAEASVGATPTTTANAYLSHALTPEARPPAAAAAPPSQRRRRQSVVSIEETPTRAEQQSGFPPAPTPKSGSVVDRLRAQRGLTSRDGYTDANSKKTGTRDSKHGPADSSTDSSEDMPMFKSQTRSAATSPSAPGQRQFPAASAATAQLTKSAPATAPVPSHAGEGPFHGKLRAQMSHSLLSSKLLDAPLASDVLPSGTKALPVDSIRSASIQAEDMGYYEFTPMLSVLEAPHDEAEAPAPEAHNDGARPASVHRGPSTANSLEYSEQGRYSYSAFGSLANSPAMSHVPDDAARSARTGTATAASAALDVSHPARSAKQLPLQTSVMSRAHGSTTDSTSSTSSESAAQAPLVLPTSSATRPFGSGVVLGARQPISVHSPSSSAPPTVFPTVSRVGPGAVAHHSTGNNNNISSNSGAKVTDEARANLLTTLRSMKSSHSSDSSTSSSSDDAAAAAAFQRQQARQVVREDHRESSFHNYSEAASSPLGSTINAPLPQHNIQRTQQQQQQMQQTPSQSSPRPQDFSATLSQDAYSFAAYSAQFSTHGSPQGHGIDQHNNTNNDASAELSRALSHSVSRPQTARSESHGAASSVGRRGSLASGGYYYGYEFGLGSPSQQSMMSNAEMGHGTASSSPGYDY